MVKDFFEALKDGFIHVTEITDPETLKKLRSDDILIDEEGYYSFSFGEKKEFELCIEPFGEEGQYCISLYKNRVRLTERLPIWVNKRNT